MYAVIVAEIQTQSLSDASRTQTEAALERALACLNYAMPVSVALEFSRSVGDEFTGVLYCANKVVETVHRLTESIRTCPLAIGVGIGDSLSQPLPGEDVLIDLPAYSRAREAFESAKTAIRSGLCVRFSTGNPDEELLNSLHLSLERIRESWTPAMSDAVRLVHFKSETYSSASALLSMGDGEFDSLLSGGAYGDYRQITLSLAEYLLKTYDTGTVLDPASAELQSNLGRYYEESLGDAKAACRSYAMAIRLAVNMPKKLLSLLYERLGRTYALQGEYSSAVNCLNEASSLAAGLADPAHAVRISTGLADVLFMSGEYASCIHALNIARGYLEEMRSRRQSAMADSLAEYRISLLAARACYSTNNVADADTLAQNALESAYALWGADMEPTGDVFLLQARVALSIGDFPVAIDYADKAIGVFLDNLGSWAGKTRAAVELSERILAVLRGEA